MRFRCAGLTDVGRKRAHNEDAYALLPERGFFVVADGMGGHAAGEVASRTAVESMLREFGDSEQSETTDLDALGETLAGAVRDANAAILRAVQERPELYGMGTTVVAARIRGDDLVIAHVGDSRAYRLRDGELERLTHDHSFVNEQVRLGTLTEEEAREHRYRNVLTRALGTADDIAPDVAHHTVRADDRILLCSDGLTSMVQDDEIRDVLDGSDDVEGACTRLVELANARGGDDNTTLILLRAESED